jgi:hypothetical protein
MEADTLERNQTFLSTESGSCFFIKLLEHIEQIMFHIFLIIYS